MKPGKSLTSFLSIATLTSVALFALTIESPSATVNAPTPEKSARDNWGLEPLGPDIPKPEWKPIPAKRELKTNFKALPAQGDALSLVKNGKPQAFLVLPQTPNASEKQAAQLLRRAFFQISNAKLPIFPEDEVQVHQSTFEANGKRYSHLISIGRTQLAKASNISADDLKADGYRLQTQGKVLFLVGHDMAPLLDPKGDPVKTGGTGPTHYIQANGTRNGAYSLLERHFECRWLWPAEAGGEIFPKQDTLILQPIHESDEPAIAQRGIRNVYPENGTEAMGRRRQKDTLNKVLQRSYSDFLKKTKNSGAWFDAMKLGQSIELNLGHSYGDYWKRFGETHQEYFALQGDGTRNQAALSEKAANRAKLDVTNPALIAHVAQEAIDKLDADPRLTSVSIAPNDGTYPSFCLCEACRLLDPPSGDPISFSIVDKFGEASRINYVSLSDRYVQYYSKVADIVAKKHPDKLLGAYAYSVYSSPPLYAKLSPNVFISYVGLSYFNEAQRQRDLQSWDQWATAAGQLQLRPNALLGSYGIPAVFTNKLGADIKHAYQTGMIGTDFDSLTHDWAGRGINYYVLAKLLWDPSLDINEIIRDYCDNGFGTASPSIQKYFAELESLTNEIAEDTGDTARTEDGLDKLAMTTNLQVMIRSYTQERIEKLQLILDAAKEQTNNADVLARINFLEQGLRYADAETTWLRAYFLPDSPDKKQQVQDALDTRLEVFTEIYDKHFYAQSPFAALYRQASMADKYEWQPKQTKKK